MRTNLPRYNPPMPAYDDDNIFAQILRGTIPNRTVFEDDHVLAFHDVNPQAPVHVLVIPKASYVSFCDFSQRADPAAIAHFFQSVGTIATQLGLDTGGYRLITNHGAHSRQEVPHFHVHILGGGPLGALVGATP